MFPTMKLGGVRKVFADENHNAFTDLCRFQGNLYLTFRSCADGHGIAPSAFVRILRSPDGSEWSDVFTFSVPDRDTRDPHFLEFDGRLFVYSGTWPGDAGQALKRNINDQLGYCVHSADGTAWEGPIAMPSTKGYYIWRAAAHDGTAYLCGRCKSGFVDMPELRDEWALQEAVLLCGTDGLEWEPRAIIQDTFGDETAMVFDAEGEITTLLRCRDPERPGLLCRSKPPYDDWERQRLNRNIGGPLLAWWGNFLVGGGRKSESDREPVTQLYWIDESSIQEALVLPSGGDNSYPGFVEIDPKHALVSYYSSHEGGGDPPYPAAIYLAEVEQA